MTEHSRIAALEILGLETPPRQASGLFGNWEPSAGRLDYEIVELMIDYAGTADVVQVGDLVALVGTTGARIAGRLESLRRRGVVKKAPTAQATSLFIPEAEIRPRGGAWALTAKSLRTAEVK